MQRTIVISTFVVLYSIFSGTVAAQSLQDVVGGVEAFYENRDSLQITFTQTVQRKYQPANSGAVKRSGTAFFQKPGKMRWDYKKPEPIYYVSNGKTLWVYEAAQNVAYRGNVEGSRLYGAMKFLFGVGKLADEFIVSLGKDEGTEVELVLKSKDGESAFKSIRLVVDKKTFEIQKTRVVDPLGDTSEIVFETVRYAPIENPEWFDWEPGEGVRVEDLSKRGK
jgi:outer membrane lipoprotein carrier protein